MKKVCVRELAAWGFDRYAYRPAVRKETIRVVKDLAGQRTSFETRSPICDALTTEHHAALSSHATRSDLLAEVHGLAWSLAVVDLRRLLCFQRRLSFNANLQPITVPAADDWDGLLQLAFAPSKLVNYSQQSASGSIVFSSSNPNLHIRHTGDAAAPLVVSGGSPFFEVARYRKRWFLRDGYHRAYALMGAGIFAVPAVIVEARSLGDLGANQPQFFPEATLMCSSPPLVTDFLDSALTIDYERPALTKTIRVTIKESFAPEQS